jgi:hypothetical protein
VSWALLGPVQQGQPRGQQQPLLAKAMRGRAGVQALLVAAMQAAVVAAVAVATPAAVAAAVAAAMQQQPQLQAGQVQVLAVGSGDFSRL